MTPQQLEEDYARWLLRQAEVLTVKGSLNEWLRSRLQTAGPSERIQLRTMCALRGKAQLYDDVAEKVRGS